KKLNNGDYDDLSSVSEIAYQLTKDLQASSNDLHFRVTVYQEEKSEENNRDLEALRRERLRRRQKDNFGFHKVELLDGNIGLIEISGMYGTEDAGRTAIAAMNLISYCDALIIDLRDNSGGQPSMTQLICSYLFDKTEHLNSFYIRKGEVTNQFWTQAYVPGPRLADIPVFVLVSENTVSAGEGFAYALKHMNRAIIIGEATAGGAHPQAPHEFPEESIVVHVPYGRAINPVTKSNWEGKGVEPHIEVPGREALKVAHIEALKRLKQLESDDKVQHGYDMIMEEVEAKHRPVVLSEEMLQKYTGRYNRGVEVKLIDGSLRVLRYLLVPMGNDKFMIENGDEQVYFVKDAEGSYSKLVVLFRDSSRVVFDRLKD
ncbi:MAG: S41 family peptidase, partial [Candidatus Hodarchaeota archaeon]